MVEAKEAQERAHPVEAGLNSVMLSTKEISLQGAAGGTMTATKLDNHLLTTTATGEAMEGEIEMAATTEPASSVNRRDTCPKTVPLNKTQEAEHVSSATKKAICLVNARILTQDHPENQWSVSIAIKRGTFPKIAQKVRVTVTVVTAEHASSATKKAICLVTARTSKAKTGVSNVSAEMTEALTEEMKAGSTTTRQNLQILDGRTTSRTRLRSKIMLDGGTPKRTTAVAGENCIRLFEN